MDQRFYLCTRCRHAWHGTIAPCCGEEPLSCDPWSSDARVWYQARVNRKAADIYEVLRTTSNWKWRSLARASRAKGREIVRVA